MGKSSTLKNHKGEAVLEDCGIKVRVCKAHGFPVGLVSNSPEFICLFSFHRIFIQDTRQEDFTLKSLEDLVTKRRAKQ